jgi:RluA family pseudouridine synthase
MKIEWQINNREDDLTLLEAVSLRVPAAPRAFIRQLCKKGRVSTSRGSTNADQPVSAGESLSIKASERLLECIQLSQLHPAQLLYEDRDCVAINKPSGLATHRAPGHEDNLLSRVQSFYRLRGENFQIAPIQRLDLGTSGIVLFGKGHSSIGQLGKSITAGTFTKRYLALVSGHIEQATKLTSEVRAKGKVKSAETSLSPVAFKKSHTLLELTLGTGRQHQIRQQLAQTGHPVSGDSRYGGATLSGCDRLFLHCHQLAFPHPVTDQLIEIDCPLPKALQDILSSLD